MEKQNIDVRARELLSNSPYPTVEHWCSRPLTADQRKCLGNLSIHLGYGGDSALSRLVNVSSKTIFMYRKKIENAGYFQEGSGRPDLLTTTQQNEYVRKIKEREASAAHNKRYKVSFLHRHGFSFLTYFCRFRSKKVSLFLKNVLGPRM